MYLTWSPSNSQADKMEENMGTSLPGCCEHGYESVASEEGPGPMELDGC
jgi:hypothetical protein